MVIYQEKYQKKIISSINKIFKFHNNFNLSLKDDKSVIETMFFNSDN